MRPTGEAVPAVTGQPVETVAWDPAWETGFSDIDDQHREILARISGLEASIREDGHRTACDNWLQLLAGYVSVHFECEEGRMVETAYPGLGAHRSAHDAVRLQVNGLLLDHLTGRQMVTLSDVSEFLRGVLYHVATLDTDLAAHLRRTARSEP